MNEGGRRFNVIHQSLVRPILLAGAERPLAIANWIASAALILGGGQWYTPARDARVTERGGDMLFREFRDLRRKPDLGRGLPGLLNYAFAEDDHAIVMKDGARLAAFECLGPDLNSASVEELDAHRALANRALIRLDENFAYQADFIRYPSADYPKRAFPDAVSSMIGHEGALHYAQEGRHYESRTVFSIACRKISEAQSKLGGVFISGAGG